MNANLKLILGLIWHLILRYQIGKTKFPTKKLMLAWLQAVIPECAVTNFTTDWNSGIALQYVKIQKELSPFTIKENYSPLISLLKVSSYL